MSFVLFLQNIRNATGGIFDAFMLQLSNLGRPLEIFLVLSFVYWCIDKKTGILMSSTMSSSLTLTAGSSVFPCTTTIRGSSVWGSLGIGCKKCKSSLHEKILAAESLFLLSLIMISRCYLGVYSLKHVLLSFGFTIFVMFIIRLIFNHVIRDDTNPKRSKIILTLIIFVFVLIAVVRSGLSSGLGLFIGFTVGALLDNYSIRFRTGGDLITKILRYIPGAILISLFCSFGDDLSVLVLPAKCSDFIQSLFISFFIAYIYPVVFTIWESKTISEKSRKIGKAIVTGICSVIILTGMIIIGIATYTNRSTADVIEMARFIIDGDEIFWKETGEDTVKEEDLGIEIIAHRGYSGIAPENTIAAFKRAVDIGADQIELDVQMTKDGVILVFHDNTLSRITGHSGKIKNFNYSEICMLDAGSWYDNVAGSYNGTFGDEKIPKLSDVCEMLQDTGVGINLELKNIGNVQGFTENVVEIVKDYNMEDRVIFSSYNYTYLKEIKAIDEELKVEFISDTANADDLLTNYPADYYNLKLSGIEEDAPEKLHAAGVKFYAWTLNDAESIRKAVDIGADGIVTNYPGIAKVVIHDEYSFLYDYYVKSYEVPVLYDYVLQESYSNYVMQGMTKVGDKLLISAYDISSHGNTVLYELGKKGDLVGIIDTGMKCHGAGIGYDSLNNLLWITGSDGYVYAFDWSGLIAGNTEPVYSFSAGFYNQNGDVVVSFLTVDDDKLYVGANMDGVDGQIKVYDITYPTSEHLLNIISIPEHIQGITFRHDSNNRNKIIMTQSYGNEDSKLLIFGYSDQIVSYAEENALCYILPEGVEQPFLSDEGLYLIFHSSARPYRSDVRVPSDRIWILK